MKNKIRRISCNEQLYLDMQDLMNTFAIQFILEYEGNVDKNRFENAIKYVLSNTNDSNLMLLGKWWCKSNEEIKIKTVNINTDNLLDDNFFKEKIDYKRHSFEVYLLNHFNKKYIVFKLLHSVSDGKGALLLIENIFKKLKNEDLLKCTNDYNEEDLVQDIALYNKNIKLKPKYELKSKINAVKSYTPIWNVISMKGYHSGVIAKIANVMNVIIESFKDRFCIMVY